MGPRDDALSIFELWSIPYGRSRIAYRAPGMFVLHMRQTLLADIILDATLVRDTWFQQIYSQTHMGAFREFRSCRSVSEDDYGVH